MAKILLVRHGSAIANDYSYLDESRWLTQEGRREVISIGQFLYKQELTYTRIFTSPYVRAVQTAEILAQQSDFKDIIEVHEPLGIDTGTTAQALSLIDKMDMNDIFIFVSHEPKIRSMAATLTQIQGFPSFPTAGVCLVESNRKNSRFLFKVSPRSLHMNTDIHSDW